MGGYELASIVVVSVTGGGGCGCPRIQVEAQDPAEPRFQRPARYDHIHHTVSALELGRIGVGRQLLVHDLLDQPRTGKADHGARLGDDAIGLRRETGRDASQRRVGKDGQVGQTRLRQLCQRGRCLGHLEQRKDAFILTGAAGRRHDDERLAEVTGQLGRAGDLFPDDGAHSSGKEVGVHHGQHHGDAINGGGAIDGGFTQ